MRSMVAKVGQVGFKRGSKEPKISPGWPKYDPGWTKERHKEAQREPKRPKRGQRGSSRGGKVVKA